MLLLPGLRRRWRELGIWCVDVCRDERDREIVRRLEFADLLLVHCEIETDDVRVAVFLSSQTRRKILRGGNRPPFESLPSSVDCTST